MYDPIANITYCKSKKRTLKKTITVIKRFTTDKTLIVVFYDDKHLFENRKTKQHTKFYIQIFFRCSIAALKIDDNQHRIK
ncbi:hypothetical protein DERP_008212 [Dermatophagoides pteronyssinus]|uniref:Uncharacterized protein n=1 Tax=Dermatophagoides pteronyssinus TaxID=6956 RepID=A0ABQ8J5W1_DERPT|nr:hypothetical protein DERP_008212 [Dermatophagoides pteronyssinus]